MTLEDVNFDINVDNLCLFESALVHEIRVRE